MGAASARVAPQGLQPALAGSALLYRARRVGPAFGPTKWRAPFLDADSFQPGVAVWTRQPVPLAGAFAKWRAARVYAGDCQSLERPLRRRRFVLRRDCEEDLPAAIQGR